MAESEYTPTTEEIINAWRYFRTENRAYDGDPEKEVRLWLAAHDAEVRAGVVAEEPEWEQRYEHLKSHAAVAMATLNGDPYAYRSPSNREAAELLASALGVPVKQEDQTTNHEIESHEA